VKELDKVRKLLATPLEESFYRSQTEEVAQKLLGKILVVRSKSGLPLGHPKEELTAGRIVETEAYRGNDPASHSARGETPRCSLMFGEPARAYVYFIYGMYEMLNFVTEPKGQAGAVLIRAIEPLLGNDLMVERRRSPHLTNGPGRLCRAMGIQMSHNGQILQGPALYVCDDGFQPISISKSGRIGIRLATERLWRFYITDNPFVSRAKQNLQSIRVDMEDHEKKG
jgi:DNA-3-methyladenine glycosylase